MNMATLPTLTARTRQSGSTLIVTMMILVLIMMLGVTAMVTSDSQFKLTGNLQFENVALNRAEVAVATAESWLANDTISPRNYLSSGFTTYSSATPELYPIGYLATLTSPNNNPLTMTWTNSNSKQVVDGDDTQRYIIEKVSNNMQLLGSNLAVGGRTSAACNQVNTYLITTRGTSIRGANKFVQSYFSRKSC